MEEEQAPSSRGVALHYAAHHGDVKEVIRLVTSGEADVNEQDYDRRTPLHVAAANGHLDVLEALVANGADCGIVDRWNRTPLADAIAGNHEDAAAFLKDKTPEGIINRSPNSPLSSLLTASLEGDAVLVNRLLQSKQVNADDCDERGRTSAHLAASEGKLLVLRVLAQYGANFNSKDKGGNRPLDNAMRWGHKDCAAFLIMMGGKAASTANQASHSTRGSIRPKESMPAMALSQVSKDALAALHSRGVREFWAWDQTDFVLEKEPFATGTGGEVYMCRFRNMNCVAKTLGKLQSQQNLLDLSNEISLMSSIRHPNIVTFFGACFQMSEPVMLLEYCPVGSLETRLIRAYHVEGPKRIKLTDPQKIKYAHQIALAMTFLHEFHMPITHRDLKPGNVLLSANDDIKIGDFGLAKFVHPRSVGSSPAPPYRMTGETGSYRFMAPEVYDHRPYDHSVDMYSYAMIVYWIYSGMRPFAECRSGHDAVRQACQQVRPDTRMLKEVQILEVCESGWAHDPKMRPSFSVVADKLEECKLHGFTKARSYSLAARFAGAVRFTSGPKLDRAKESDSEDADLHSESKQSSTEAPVQPQEIKSGPLAGKSPETRKGKFAKLFS